MCFEDLKRMPWKCQPGKLFAWDKITIAQEPSNKYLCF